MKLSILSWFLAAPLLAPAGRAGEPAIVEKARSYLGTEAALEAVESIHLVGRVVKEGAGGPAGGVSAAVDIVFEKPFQESITMIAPDRVIHTALDNYEGWQQVQTSVAAGQRAVDFTRSSQLTLLNGEQTRVLRADTLENLWFYRGAERAGGAAEDGGAAAVDGIDCEKVVFTYSPGVVYVRYFDRATGRLVCSDTLGGARIREHGEIVAGGVRFPKSIVTVETEGPSKGTTSTYTFERIDVNGQIPADLFAVPLLQPTRAAEAPPFPATGSVR